MASLTAGMAAKKPRKKAPGDKKSYDPDPKFKGKTRPPRPDKSTPRSASRGGK